MWNTFTDIPIILVQSLYIKICKSTENSQWNLQTLTDL